MISYCEFSDDRLVPISVTGDNLTRMTFRGLHISERQIEHAVRSNLSVIVPGGLLIATQYYPPGNTTDRIDILAVDDEADLICVELKRGRDPNLIQQGLRYASAVRQLSLNDVIDALARRRTPCDIGKARADVLRHFGWSCTTGKRFPRRIAVVLVADSFSAEEIDYLASVPVDSCTSKCIRIVPFLEKTGRVIVQVHHLSGVDQPNRMVLDINQEGKMIQEDNSIRRGIRYMVRVGAFESGLVPHKRAIQFAVLRLLEAGIAPADLETKVRRRSTQLLIDHAGKCSPEQFQTAIEEKGGKPHFWFCQKASDLFYSAIDNRTYAVTQRWDDGVPRALWYLQHEIESPVIEWREIA